MTIFIHDVTDVVAGDIKALSNTTTAELCITSQRGLLSFDLYGDRAAITDFCSHFPDPEGSIKRSEVTASLSVHNINKCEVEMWKANVLATEVLTIDLGGDAQRITLFRQEA
ncbi:MAG: hypothetical protein GY813_09270 [Halieaceae bacterium]|nr:hypothetical protein [Halieaceae bacterium]